MVAACVLAAVGAAVRPSTFGHREEGRAGSVALAAIELAVGGQPLAAGIVLGLAIGAKEWALLVAPAVVLAGSAAQWKRVAAAASLSVVLLLGVMAIGNPTSFRLAHEGQRAGDKHTLTPATLWFRLGTKRIVG